MKLVLKMMKKYWYFAIFAAVFMVAEVYVDLYQPKMMAVIVDEGILGVHNGGVSNLQLIISVGIRMVLVVALGGMTGILSAVATNMMGQSSGNDMRKACFEKAMHLSFQQTDAFSSASLITRITNDVGQVQRLEMQLVRGLIRCLMFFAGGTTALLSLDLSFGVIVACAFPLILIDVIFVIWRTNPLFLMLQKALDKVNAIMEENVNGIRVVKAFVQEDPGGLCGRDRRRLWPYPGTGGDRPDDPVHGSRPEDGTAGPADGDHDSYVRHPGRGPVHLFRGGDRR